MKELNGEFVDHAHYVICFVNEDGEEQRERYFFFDKKELELTVEGIQKEGNDIEVYKLTDAYELDIGFPDEDFYIPEDDDFDFEARDEG